MWERNSPLHIQGTILLPQIAPTTFDVSFCPLYPPCENYCVQCLKKQIAHSKCFGWTPIGIVLNGSILFQSTEQTLGDAPNAEFHLRLKVSFLVWERFTMSFAALMIMLGAIVDMILLRSRIGKWKNNGVTNVGRWVLMVWSHVKR